MADRLQQVFVQVYTYLWKREELEEREETRGNEMRGEERRGEERRGEERREGCEEE